MQNESATVDRLAGGPAVSPALQAVGVVCDYAEEAWPSMELAAELVLSNADVLAEAGLRAEPVRPALKRRLTALSALAARQSFDTADRVINRFWDYPRLMRPLRARYDLFHVVDHSYAHLSLGMPPGRSVVTCHDLDAIRCLVEPLIDPRPGWYHRLARRVLAGLQRAAAVICVSAGTRDELLKYGLVPAERLVIVSNGVHPAHTVAPTPVADAEAERLLGPARDEAEELLHVGSTIPRKNIETLIRVFAAVRTARPGARLVRVGGPFTAEQEQLAERLGVADGIAVLPYLQRDVLAAVYRRAALVLLPSWREGFGLPIAEAMACGTPVVASGLPVLHEVGGEAADYCAPGDVPGWREAVLRLLAERGSAEARAGRRQRLLARASAYDWRRQAGRIAGVYRSVLRGAREAL